MTRKHILDCPKAVKIINNFNLKKIVAGRGHDCGGLIADLYFGKTLVANYHDDGWGGEPEINFINKAHETSVTQFLTKQNFALLLFNEGGYDFMKTPERINTHTQIKCLVTATCELKDREKILKKCERAFIFGTNYSQSIVSWPNKKLSDMPKGVLKMTYNAYKKDLKKGEKFFNTDEQLKSLGINP